MDRVPPLSIESTHGSPVPPNFPRHQARTTASVSVNNISSPPPVKRKRDTSTLIAPFRGSSRGGTRLPPPREQCRTAAPKTAHHQKRLHRENLQPLLTISRSSSPTFRSKREPSRNDPLYEIINQCQRIAPSLKWGGF